MYVLYVYQVVVVCLPGAREPSKRDTAYLFSLATERTGGVFSHQKSDTAYRSALSGRCHLIIFSAPAKKNIPTTTLFQLHQNRLRLYVDFMVDFICTLLNISNLHKTTAYYMNSTSQLVQGNTIPLEKTGYVTSEPLTLEDL